ncbi:EF-1 guanine nucleotide exchange domain protein (macronuclear) [Tetrahymena thermophila SB210]|uniref:EF-1 guanine nucleotide exchange domain protein n=1 Tax=Tetrahymena thermophila (strain SB210) TaxID=312017 RepID=Q23QS7_TETTS|nr:EF-1 guanine nucleotide exchange domain protein [Tetrahymena thermophila SB210]EAR98811.1 EF-1 guanine nucleotide exchange domain protein [Tetrahymena thermophila SB210]|eukprot:XP_001019056.1 EF-1 guanine nucleotide exchange domain protein [Tetrahymena thermophila SB210]
MEINKTFLEQLNQQKKNKNTFELNESDDDIDSCPFDTANNNQNAQQVKEVIRSDSLTFLDDFESKKSKDSVPKVSYKPTGSSAKSLIVLEVKPYSGELNLISFSDQIFDKVKIEGLVWNREVKILPISFSLKKIQVRCVIEDDKVIVDDLIDQIIILEDVFVDIISFTKV